MAADTQSSNNRPANIYTLRRSETTAATVGKAAAPFGATGGCSLLARIADMYEINRMRGREPAKVA